MNQKGKGGMDMHSNRATKVRKVSSRLKKLRTVSKMRSERDRGQSRVWRNKYKIQLKRMRSTWSLPWGWWGEVRRNAGSWLYVLASRICSKLSGIWLFGNINLWIDFGRNEPALRGSALVRITSWLSTQSQTAVFPRDTQIGPPW